MAEKPLRAVEQKVEKFSAHKVDKVQSKDASHF